MTTRPPSGTPPPTVAELEDVEVDLAALSEEVCARYYAEFDDEHERYGDAGVAWCRHDNQYLLFWAIADVQRMADLEREVTWLARVLHARDFPVDRLARDLQLAAGVVREADLSERREAVAARLEEAAELVAGLELG